MLDDRDMKIAGDRPSRSIIENAQADSPTPEQMAESRELLDRAALLGAALAGEICNMQHSLAFCDDGGEWLIQRRLLMCFAVSYQLDRCAMSSLVSRTALNGFYNTLKRLDVDFYDDLSINGAFSFYFLAIRSTGDTVRRIGQTFAMLCSHDGDPIFQELGETLFCSYSETVRQQIGRYDLLK